MRQLQDDIVNRRRISRMEAEPFIEQDEGQSSIHVHLFLQHTAQNSNTWMMSCMHFENIEG